MLVTHTCEPRIELLMDVFKTQSVELAIDVLKVQSKALVNSLKDYLTVLPSPQCIEEVLAAAIHQLAETDPDACRWMLRNPDYLEPELDLVELAMNLALSKLQNQGFVLEQDFKFEPNGRLQINQKAKAQLMVGNSACDRLLLEEILQRRD
jgi:hypothetical protein